MRFARLRRTSLCGALTAALALSLAACGGGEEKSANGLEKSEITVGVMPITEGAAVQIAISKGFFKAEGLKVKIKTVTGAAEALPQLKGGSLDIAHGGHVGIIQAAADGLYKLRIVAEASAMTKNLNGVLVAKDSPIKSPKDLAGKKIGTNAAGNQNSLLLRATLEPYGVQIDEKKDVVVAPFPAQEQLLKTDKAQAIIVPEPFVTQIQQSIGARILTDFSSGPTKDFPITGFASTEEFAKKNPKTIAAFQRGLVKAQALATDRAVLQEAMPKFTKMDPKLVSVISMNAYPTSTSATRLQRVADVMKQFGYLKQPFDVKSIVLENG
ncbi:MULTISPECIES: ABC transporter substrate-binding protein [Thermomonosporaceae]|uniref:ABC transporter substrate-binding protein n=1 Tax=Thermomonosporaceae TaxID=2012 RepID=UPI00255A837D|nr:MULTISPECIES: ABC transporter substrate-binding protein [Thermomonosporaceae]MDL4774733.1 ABC transporter substrate-binding protein [Actinomadura xylanilytica]